MPTLSSRPAQSLDGDWKTIVDPYDNGTTTTAGSPRDEAAHPNSDAYFMDAKPKDPSDRVEYDFDASPALRVPGDWNTQRRELYYYEGTVWYRTRFDPAAPDRGSGSSCVSARRQLPGRRLPEWRQAGDPRRRLHSVLF